MVRSHLDTAKTLPPGPVIDRIPVQPLLADGGDGSCAARRDRTFQDRDDAIAHDTSDRAEQEPSGRERMGTEVGESSATFRIVPKRERGSGVGHVVLAVEAATASDFPSSPDWIISQEHTNMGLHR